MGKVREALARGILPRVLRSRNSEGVPSITCLDHEDGVVKVVPQPRAAYLLSLLREADAVNEICISRIGTQVIKSRFSPQPKE